MVAQPVERFLRRPAAPRTTWWCWTRRTSSTSTPCSRRCRAWLAEDAVVVVERRQPRTRADLAGRASSRTCAAARYGEAVLWYGCKIMRRAVCPGSFDPVTLGHLDIVGRAAALYDEVTVAVLVNKKKSSLFTVDERIDTARARSPPTTATSSWTASTACSSTTAGRTRCPVIVKGLRAVSDFDYELQMAQMNHGLADVETMFMTTNPLYSFLSSSLVKEVADVRRRRRGPGPATPVHRRLVARLAELARSRRDGRRRGEGLTGGLADVDRAARRARPSWSATPGRMPMSASCVVNRAEVLGLLDDAARRGCRAQLGQARGRCSATATASSTRAAARPSAVLAGAQPSASGWCQQTDVVRQARERGRRGSLQEAREQAEAMRAEVEDYVDAKLANFEIVLTKTLDAVERGRARSCRRAASSTSCASRRRPAAARAERRRPPGRARSAGARPTHGRCRAGRSAVSRRLPTGPRDQDRTLSAAPRPPQAPRARHARARAAAGVDARGAPRRCRRPRASGSPTSSGCPVGAELDLDLRLESVVEGVLVTGDGRRRPLSRASADAAWTRSTTTWSCDLQELFAYAEHGDDEAGRGRAARMEGDLLDLEPVLRDAVVLALPLTPLCSEDCAGLCVDCGERLDDLPEDHGHDAPDPRWAGSLDSRTPNTHDSRGEVSDGRPEAQDVAQQHPLAPLRSGRPALPTLTTCDRGHTTLPHTVCPSAVATTSAPSSRSDAPRTCRRSAPR